MASTREPAITLTDVGLAIMRIMIGAMYTAHGVQKLFEMGLAGVTGFFTQAGIPHPGVMAPFIAWLEFAGGILLMCGLATRAVALLFACEMTGAIWYVHGGHGFFLPLGWEYAAVLIAANLALALVGPGYLSVDGGIARARFRKRNATTLSDDWLAKAGKG